MIKAFGREEGETDRLLEVAKTAIAARYRVAKTQGWFSALSALLTAIGTALFIVIGGQMVRAGTMSLGEMILIAALMLQFYSPLQQVVGQIASLQSAFASAERVLGLLDKAPEVIERPDARSLSRKANALFAVLRNILDRSSDTWVKGDDPRRAKKFALFLKLGQLGRIDCRSTAFRVFPYLFA